MVDYRQLRQHRQRYRIARWLSRHPVWLHVLLAWLFRHTARLRKGARWIARRLGWLRILAPSRYLKRLDRYIIVKFIGTYVFAIMLIISLAIVFDVNENLNKFAEYPAPLRAIVFDYYANFVPYFSNLFSPLFVFIAVIFFTSKLAGNSEIVAMLAAGVSFKRLLRPYMFSCVLIAMLSYYLSAYVIPHGTVIRQNFEVKYKNKTNITSAENVQLQVGKGIIAYIQHYDNNMKKGYGFSLDKFENKKLVSHMTAMEIQYDTISDTKYHCAQLEDTSPEGSSGAYRERRQVRHHHPDGAYRLGVLPRTAGDIYQS